MTVTIWCYKCGSIWFKRQVVELYEGPFVRCPAFITTGTNKVRCDGLTDGVQA